MARAGRREERKARNRTKLLEAARKVFTEKGLGEATARDIVRETDLASGTFYNYFRDKEHAFRALLEEMAERSRALARTQWRDPGASVEERVANAYRAYFGWAVGARELFGVFRRNAGAIALMSDISGIRDGRRGLPGGHPPGRSRPSRRRGGDPLLHADVHGRSESARRQMSGIGRRHG